MLTWVTITVMGLGERVRFFCGDETRLGLKTISGRKITAKAVKPIGKVQWQFQATYLYGVVEPSTGEHFFYEFTHLNSDCFGVYLQLLSEQFAESVLIVQLDNPDSSTQGVSAWALGAIGDKRAIEPLRELLRDGNASVRGNAGRTVHGDFFDLEDFVNWTQIINVRVTLRGVPLGTFIFIDCCCVFSDSAPGFPRPSLPWLVVL